MKKKQIDYDPDEEPEDTSTEITPLMAKDLEQSKTIIQIKFGGKRPIGINNPMPGAILPMRSAI
jgi:hypothetical protein